MTEAEAKNKWCPMVRFDADGTLNNRDILDEDHQNSYCIGSACMMWRYGASSGECIPAEDTTTHGYCGLSGKS